MNDAPRHVLVLGATGYIGTRLVPELLGAGHRVRCLTRSASALREIPWSSDVDVVEGDLGEPDALAPVFDQIDTVVYLVHSLELDDFEEIERRTARDVCALAEAAGVEHIVYMSGLGRETDDLSPHLRSRHAVGVELAGGGASVTELRAAVVIGAGSASFEMLRSLVERLPAMITPTWITRTTVEPIAIGDVLRYLTAAVDRGPGAGHEIFEIGCGTRITYRELMDTYAEVAGLRRRLIVPVPFLTTRISTWLVDILTPLPRVLGASLIGSLRNDVVVTDDRAHELSSVTPLTARTAIESAISAIGDLDIPTRRAGVTRGQRAARPQPSDPDWSGGTVYEDRRSAVIDAPAARVHAILRARGEDRARSARGLPCGRRSADVEPAGEESDRGRPPDDETSPDVTRDRRPDGEDGSDRFRCATRTRYFGQAAVEWHTTMIDDGRTQVARRTRFVPRGVSGRLYWWASWPVQVALFPLVAGRLGQAARNTR